MSVYLCPCVSGWCPKLRIEEEPYRCILAEESSDKSPSVFPQAEEIFPVDLHDEKVHW